LITFPGIITYSEYQYRPALVWSPDSTFVSAAVPSMDPLAADASVAFYRIGADGIVQPLATVPGNFVFGGLMRPAFSPTGEHVVYSRSVPEESGLEAVHLLALTDGMVDSVIGQWPSPSGQGWAPDGSRYAFSSVPDGALGSGYALDRDGTSQPFAANLSALASLRWLDPTTVVFIAKLAGADWSLYRQTLGSEPALLAGGLTFQAGLDVR
jgi:hypothetical protein